jgi:cytochrome P450
MLYLLSTHEDIQIRLRAEIAQAKVKTGGERLGYDEILALPLLDAVVKETLRLYPPVPFVRRV